MKNLRALLIDAAIVVGSVAAALLLVGAVLALSGNYRVIPEWIEGAAGSRAQILMSLKGACPLILTGLAAGIAFRSGVFNIGAEGQSLAGMLATVWLATRLAPEWPAPVAIPAALVAGALGGALWALLPAALDRYRGVPVVLSTILLNFIALQLVGLLLNGPLHAIRIKTDIPQSDALTENFQFPVLLHSGPGSVHAGILVALALAAVAWVVQSRTALGFEIRVTGLNPLAARYAGIPVTARQFAVMLLSGAFAGLAGTIQLMGVEGGHYLGTAPPSYGYAGIAVALLGRLHPAGIVLAAIFFAFLDHGADALGFIQFPPEISDIVKGVMVLLVLGLTAFAGRRRQMAREQ